MELASPEISFGAARVPMEESKKISGKAPRTKPATGVPHASASATTNPKGSSQHGVTNATDQSTQFVVIAMPQVSNSLIQPRTLFSYPIACCSGVDVGSRVDRVICRTTDHQTHFASEHRVGDFERRLRLLADLRRFWNSCLGCVGRGVGDCFGDVVQGRGVHRVARSHPIVPASRRCGTTSTF